jgi:hypothetical protein
VTIGSGGEVPLVLEIKIVPPEREPLEEGGKSTNTTGKDPRKFKQIRKEPELRR